MMKKMMKGILLICLFIPFNGKIYAQFDGPVGTANCQAIYSQSDKIVSWATGCQIIRGDQDIAYPLKGKVSFGTCQAALEYASENTLDAVSLGDAGVAILTFDRPIQNGSGADFAVFENSFDDSSLELAFVEVSSDGLHFVRFPAVSLTNSTEQVGTFGRLDPVNIHNLAGKYRIGWGTPFDLEDLKDSANIDINNIRFVKIIDVVGSTHPDHASYDVLGNMINDPYPTDFVSGGFDLTGVAIIHGGEPYIMSNLNAFHLSPGTLLKPDASSGEPDAGGIISSYFAEGIFQYHTAYNTNWGGFTNDGFVISNRQNDSVPANDHSAMTAGGMKGKGTPYLSAYYSTYDDKNHCVIELKDQLEREVQGVYVTNSTTSYYVMLNGDTNFKTEPFGGVTGTKKDWLKLIAIGYDQSGETGRAEFYLADYQFDDADMDYIVNDWRWFDLSGLGKVIKVEFIMEGSEIYTTPTYFCLDQFTVKKSLSDPPVRVSLINEIDMSIYPNPCVELIHVANTKDCRLSLFNMSGVKLEEKMSFSDQTTFNMAHRPAGIYLIQAANRQGKKSVLKFVKK